MDPLTPICKFIPNCSRTNCQFRHPVTKVSRLKYFLPEYYHMTVMILLSSSFHQGFSYLCW